MKLLAKISDGKIMWWNPEQANNVLKGLDGKEVDITIEKHTEQRTLAQNRALHLWCEQMAQELTEKHIDKREFFKDSFFLEWTKEGVKEDIWRPVQRSLLNKKSTTQLLSTEEIDKIWDNINRVIIDKYKGEVVVPPFPSGNY